MAVFVDRATDTRPTEPMPTHCPDTDGGRDQRCTRRRLSVLLAWTVVGCLGAGPTAGSEGSTTTTAAVTGTATPTATAGTAKPAALDSTLQAVARSADPEATAESRGLRTRDGRVLVVVVLKSGRARPTEPELVVTSRTDQSVVAYVAYADLEAVAAHENVSAVRPPNPVAR